MSKVTIAITTAVLTTTTPSTDRENTVLEFLTKLSPTNNPTALADATAANSETYIIRRIFEKNAPN